MRKYGRYTRRKFLRDSALFSAGLAGISLAGCTTTTVQPTTTAPETTTVVTTATPKTGGTLRVARWSVVSNFDPRTGDARMGPQIWALVCQKLLIPSPDEPYERVLCEDYTTSADQMSIHFTLRDGVKFHDGSDFTAQDVKDQMEVIIGVQQAPAKIVYRSNFTDLASVDIDSDLETTFNLNKASADIFIDNLCCYQVGYVVPSSYMTNTAAMAALIGTGPYTMDITKYTSGVTATMNLWPNYWAEGMEGYWKGTCYIDTVINKMVAEESVRWSGLQAGDYDLIDFRNSQTFLNAQAQGGPYTYVMSPGDFYQRTIINVRNFPFNSSEFRKALIMGINWDEYNSVVYTGWTKWLDIYEGSRFEYPDQQYLQSLFPAYDRNKAAAIIQSFKNTGALTKRNNYINILYDSTGYAGASGDYLATEYAKIGLNVTLIDKTGGETKQFRINNAYMPADPAANPKGWYDIMTGSGEFKGAFMFYQCVFAPFHSRSGLVLEPDGISTNYAGIRDSQLDAWIDETKTADDSRRHELFNLIQERVLTLNYHVPHVSEMQMWAYNPVLKGLDEFCLSFRNNEYSMSGLWLDR